MLQENVENKIKESVNDVRRSSFLCMAVDFSSVKIRNRLCVCNTVVGQDVRGTGEYHPPLVGNHEKVLRTFIFFTDRMSGKQATRVFTTFLWEKK